MKKVVLNDIIIGLKNDTIVTETGRYIADKEGMQVAETVPVKFGEIALQTIINQPTGTDEEALQLFVLGEKLQQNLDTEKPTEITLDDAEFAYVNEAIARQPVIVKARFLQMVERLNAKPTK